MFRKGDMYDLKPAISKAPRLGRMTPFRIFGGTYFIGTYQASCHLIDTGDGLIMIDPGYSSTAYLVIDAIYRLGFRPEDIKYIINTHWHGDHTEATADIAALTGAKTLIGRFDAEKAGKYFTPDILVDDGYVLTLGNKEITFLHTPGHTKGTISPFYYEREGNLTYRVGMFGGAGLNTLVPERYDFDGARDAYFASLERLKTEKVDIFIGNHTWNNGTFEKYQEMMNTGENVFIDSSLWHRFLENCKERLENIIKRENESK